MKEIKLTQGQVAIVDDWWYDELNKEKWHAWWNKYTQSFYAARKDGKRPFRKTIYMHRKIAKTPENMMCDHINHDTLYNVESNLRNVTNSQNQMNRRGAQSNNKLGERGIHVNSYGWFVVRVMVGKKNVYSEKFKTLEEAIPARNDAYKRLHGEFGGF